LGVDVGVSVDVAIDEAIGVGDADGKIVGSGVDEEIVFELYTSSYAKGIAPPKLFCIVENLKVNVKVAYVLLLPTVTLPVSKGFAVPVSKYMGKGSNPPLDVRISNTKFW
jgi:hypothetical protein